MYPIAVSVSSPLNLALPQTLSILICSVAYCLAMLDATTIRCCDGGSTEPALVTISAITAIYHAVAMVVECYLRLWASEPPLKKQGIQLPTVYSHLAFIIITPFVWAYWVILLPLHATGYEGQAFMEGQHYFTPMLILEGLEIGALAWLWGWSLVERLKAKKFVK
ncbi:hypothetical protein DL96DRAFT_1615850 [Flagelloscypha sp. PMI_526]|nr:hypothetical protein DL96DRAFT_1615850 [Flagelloscypha sp. PMI_526]